MYGFDLYSFISQQINRFCIGLGDNINTNGGKYEKKTVVVEPNLITSEGPGTTLPFVIEIIRATKGDKTANDIANAMLVGR